MENSSKHYCTIIIYLNSHFPVRASGLSAHSGEEGALGQDGHAGPRVCRGVEGLGHPEPRVLTCGPFQSPRAGAILTPPGDLRPVRGSPGQSQVQGWVLSDVLTPARTPRPCLGQCVTFGRGCPGLPVCRPWCLTLKVSVQTPWRQARVVRDGGRAESAPSGTAVLFHLVRLSLTTALLPGAASRVP